MPPPATGQIKVGVLLPLSGPNAELGKAMLEAAQLALFATPGERLTLVPRDTAGAGGAAGAARSAVGDGAQLILGPLLGPEVEAVRPIAAEARINVIAFATQTQVAGGNVFLMGFLPRQEVAREVSFARERGIEAVRCAGAEHALRTADDRRAARYGRRGRRHRDQGRISDPNGADAAAAVKRLFPGAGPEAKPNSTRCCCRSAATS